MKRKKPRVKFPPGWDERRVQSVIRHYDRQTDKQAIAEDESRVAANSSTTMRVPSPLVGKVRAMIAKHLQNRRKSA
jgi:hypothetical protein